MNILFLTMLGSVDVTKRGIYSELMKKFHQEGHTVYIVSPSERREGKPTSMTKGEGVYSLRVKTLNVTKTNVVEKGLGQVSIEYLFKRAIKKYFGNVNFDLVLYSTPPITFTNVVKYAKKQNPHAISYLLLKDIFPQNAVDLGMLSKSGIKGLLYKFFRNKEKELYKVSDFIGCMSPANVKYVLKHNPNINPTNVEVAPNSIELQQETHSLSEADRRDVLEKYSIPTDTPIFIYGGNLGKPQGIPFLIACMEACKNRKDCHFLIVGGGTEYGKIEAWYKENQPPSVTLLSSIPKDDYDRLAKACQVGLIFLDYRFTIPNYPSRLLPYLENKMPIIVCTDPNCDMGAIAEANGFGVWTPSNNVNAFVESVDRILTSDFLSMGESGYEFLKNNYLVEHTYNQIIKHIN